MTDYRIHPIRFAGKIQSYVVTINGKTFVQEKDGVMIYGKNFKRKIDNNWYPVFKSEAEIDEWVESLKAPIIFEL